MSGDQVVGEPVRRPRVVARPRVAPGPLRDLKDLLYELYLEAGAPSLDELVRLVAADDGLAGAPTRATIGRVLGSPDPPAAQPDVVATAMLQSRPRRSSTRRWTPAASATGPRSPATCWRRPPPAT
ncbi:hypothetical protein [Actinomadura rubrisoli]|uniref:Uncharacterized protein n=1 Tax=Actinomadura rubrisoli TaxID=2530368 RepID=A0A4R5CEL1_9ACTN|nr:hypothetical protein [Actinomadura rubrisoli]TDD95634.1 hypothetical protein E1298_04460 [Actinomadura rubrisoli]